MKAAPTVKPTIPVNAPDIVTLVVVFMVALFLPKIPLLNLLVWPITELTTLIHEMGHAVMCVLTGGHVSGMTIVSDGAGHGGLTFCRGGIPFIYSQTGYLGTTLAGCGLIAMARYPRASKGGLIGLGVAFLIAAITFMLAGVTGGAGGDAVVGSGSGFGPIASMILGLALGAAFIRFGFKLIAKWANMLLLFVGVEMGMAALSDVWLLIQVSLGLYGNPTSDAGNMQLITGVPALIWALAWGGITVWMLLMTISWTYDPDFGKKKTKSVSA